MKTLRIILIALLLGCLLPLPYGYFSLVRIFAILCFGLFAYKAYEKGKMQEVIIFGVLLLLFQPIYKIYLGRVIWNIVDVVVAIYLIVTMKNEEDN